MQEIESYFGQKAIMARAELGNRQEMKAREAIIRSYAEHASSGGRIENLGAKPKKHRESNHKKKHR